jgi:hypothetical protein
MKFSRSSWVHNSQLEDLPEDLVKPKKKLTKDLAAAYDMVADRPDLDTCKALLLDLQEKHQAKKAKAAKAGKKKNEPETDEDEDVDMEDVEDESEVPKSSKKRKAAEDAEVCAVDLRTGFAVTDHIPDPDAEQAREET